MTSNTANVSNASACRSHRRTPAPTRLAGTLPLAMVRAVGPVAGGAPLPNPHRFIARTRAHARHRVAQPQSRAVVI